MYKSVVTNEQSDLGERRRQLNRERVTRLRERPKPSTFHNQVTAVSFQDPTLQADQKSLPHEAVCSSSIDSSSVVTVPVMVSAILGKKRLLVYDVPIPFVATGHHRVSHIDTPFMNPGFDENHGRNTTITVYSSGRPLPQLSRPK